MFAILLMRNALFVLLLAGFGLCGCVVRYQRLDQAPRQTRLSADRIILPTTFIKDRPYVELKINGKGPYLFLVDTGALGVSITPQVAREARVATSRKYVAKIIGASDDVEGQLMGLAGRIESPGFSLEVVAVTILSPESADLLLDRSGLAGGIIGMSAFRDVLLEIDFPQRKVSVAKRSGTTTPPGTGIAYTEQTPHVTLATPSAQHGTITALIDTGGDGDFQLADIADYPVRAGLVKADAYTFGIGGYWRAQVGQLSGDIRLGTAIWRNPAIYTSGRKGENLIGSKALASWKVVLDQGRKLPWVLEENQMSITTWDGPVESDGRPVVYGFAAIPDSGGMLVKEVDAGSRAERAGLKVGDRIVSVTAGPGGSGQTANSRRTRLGGALPANRRSSKSPCRFPIHFLRNEQRRCSPASRGNDLPV